MDGHHVFRCPVQLVDDARHYRRGRLKEKTVQFLRNKYTNCHND